MILHHTEAARRQPTYVPPTPDRHDNDDAGEAEAHGNGGAPGDRPAPHPRSSNTNGGRSVQGIMHARLEAMAKPRKDDSPRLARLRAVLRDQRIMSRVVANVDSWPELSEQQWAEAIALLQPRRDF